MPITADDILRMADEQPVASGEPGPTTPVLKSGSGGATIQSTPPSPAEALADAFAEATPGPAFVKGAVRGLAERVAAPVGRLAGAAGYLSSAGELPPESGPAALAGDVIQTGYALHPETRMLAAGGAAVQGIGEQLGLAPNSARILSIAAETGAGLRGLVRAGKTAAREGETLLAKGGELRTPVTPTGVAQLTRREQVGAELSRAARTTLLRNKRDLGGALNAMDTQITAAMPTIDAASPGYKRLNDALATVSDRQIKFPGDVQKSLDTIQAAIRDGQPVDTKLVMNLRTRLRQLTSFADSADPDLAIAGKNAGAVRRTITDAVEASIPDQNLAGRWVEARTAYNTQYATPWRLLRNVVKRDVSPAKAFDAVFNPNDMHTFRALTEVVGGSPAIRGKLQMGFLESLADATQGFEQAEAAHKAFNTMRPALAASGVFNHQELQALELFLKRRELPTLMEKVKSAMDQSITMRKGGVATGLGFLTWYNPVAGIAAMVGAGALPQLRRIAVLPPGSPAAKRLAAVAIAKTDQFAKSLRQAEDPTPEEDIGQDSE